VLPETPGSPILPLESFDSPRKPPLPGKLFARNLSALEGRDAKVAVGGELADSNSHSVWRQTVLFQTGQARSVRVKCSEYHSLISNRRYSCGPDERVASGERGGHYVSML